MGDSRNGKVMAACTVVTTVCAVISTAVIVWQQANGVPANWATYVAAFVAGFGLGYSARYLVRLATGRTEHNRLCREMLKDLEKDGPGKWREKYMTALKVDEARGAHGTENALASLVEQGCVRGVRLDYVHGRANAHVAFGEHFGATGKKYVDD